MKTADIEDMAEQIQTKDDFEEFLRLLLSDLETDGSEWENRTLKMFLDGLHGFTRDLQNYYDNRGEDITGSEPSWRVFAEILLAARVYE